MCRRASEDRSGNAQAIRMGSTQRGGDQKGERSQLMPRLQTSIPELGFLTGRLCSTSCPVEQTIAQKGGREARAALPFAFNVNGATRQAHRASLNEANPSVGPPPLAAFNIFGTAPPGSRGVPSTLLAANPLLPPAASATSRVLPLPPKRHLGPAARKWAMRGCQPNTTASSSWSGQRGPLPTTSRLSEAPLLVPTPGSAPRSRR